MRKFKNIAATIPAAGRRSGTPTRRRLLAGLAAVALASRLRPDERALADQPASGGFLAENFTWLDRPRPAPTMPFTRADDGEITLAAFQGRVVLLNFWATWCAPCVHEMPSLDRLQAKLRDEGLDVVAVSVDHAGLDRVKPFFQRQGIGHLSIYLDSAGALSKAFGINGLPTTLLIDREGRIVGGMEGPADWDSDEAVAMVRQYLERPERV
jgi:thiol-disulfide isomerase/thioredoxin